MLYNSWQVNKNKIKQNARFKFDYDRNDHLLYPKFKNNTTSYLQVLEILLKIITC